MRLDRDCSTCPVALSQPIESNDLIVDIYFLLPQNYDPMSGVKVISFPDVIEVFKLFEVPVAVWDDYYQRIMYFHECIRKEIAAREERKSASGKTSGGR